MRGSYIWAGLMTAAIVGWMATGNVIIGGQGPANPDGSALDPTVQQTKEAPLFRVSVQRVAAQQRSASLELRGQTEAKDRVSVLAQADGLVTKVAVEKGDRVVEGAPLCRIEKGARSANLASAEAAVAQAQLDFDAQSKLSERGFAAEIRVKTAKATLDAALAQRDLAALDLKRTEIFAPFGGIVERVPVELGSRLGIGSPCAEIVAMDPMKVSVQVSERDIAAISTGMEGKINLINGIEAVGTVDYIAPNADSATRTYKVEFRVPNPGDVIRAGMTTEVEVELDSTEAHRISTAYLVLNDAGQIGVRTIGGENTVVFMPVTIIADTNDGAWVTGLPDTVSVITVGQDFVVAGQKVEPVFETAQLSETAQ